MFRFLALLFPLTTLGADRLVVWNVGQGQWITEVHTDHCQHYDVGGEFDVTSDVLKYCRDKRNILHLSHWDWDHISFANSFSRRVREVCLTERPQGVANRYKQRQIAEIPLCQAQIFPRDFQTLFKGEGQKLANDSSSVVYSQPFQVLIPGDSTKAMEKTWAWSTSRKTQGLILGHHGSRTSTSLDLLRRLPNLKWALASARKSRYGHPHKQVRELLRHRKIPLLRTEDWGHIHFLQNSETTDRKPQDIPN